MSKNTSLDQDLVIVTQSSGDYTLIDSGNKSKLEAIGPYRLVRPAPQAVWPTLRPGREWTKSDAVYERDASGSGRWQWRRPVKREFDVMFGDLAMRVQLTDFGHIGIFPEQAANWQWLNALIRTRLSSDKRDLHVLNLFGYTGGSTLAASQAGAHVVHVDAAKGAVEWARTNARLSHLDGRPIRWLVDDASKFVQREIRRGNRYHGIILDPPSFGRGPKCEVFKIEDQLLPLLDGCRQLLAKDACFLLYSCHTPGFTPIVMHNQLQSVVAERNGQIESGEMVISDQNGRYLPSGACARWSASD